MANTATLKHPKPQIPHPAPAEAPALAPTLNFAMLSHVGRVRHANEDACDALPERGAFVVCDGMGGAAAGEIASHLASEAFLHALSRPRRIPPKSASAGPDPHSDSDAPAELYPPNHPHSRLTQAVRAANHAVFRHSRKSPRLQGMGTTLVGALLDNVGAHLDDVAVEDASHLHNGGRASPTPTLWLAHVGDSRCYRLRRGVLHQLTRDHSFVEEQVTAGVLSRVQAVASPFRNVITRAVGTQLSVEPEIAAHAVQPGDLYLLASDGLTRELDDPSIAAILTQTLTQPLARKAAPALQSACQALIDAANRIGGRDNITVMLIACP